MKSNNFLVTYDDLTTMGLTQQLDVNPPTGSQCATKNFINTYYRADPTALSGYADNQLPPYQAIIPTTVPYLACYAIEVSNGSTPSTCFGYTDTYESWRVVLLDQFKSHCDEFIKEEAKKKLVLISKDTYEDVMELEKKHGSKQTTKNNKH